MATSGTATFDLSIDEIVEEAYERCGIQTNSGYDLKKARRSLNVLFSEWGNRGVHLWKIQLNAVALVSGLAFYLSQKYAPERTQQLKLYYEDEVKRALDEDGSRSSTYITPAQYYPTVT
jgi:hypothetical protein